MEMKLLPNTANKMLNVKNDIDELTQSNNAKFAIRIEHYHYLTKDENKATSFIKINSKASTEATIIKDLKDPNNT